MSNASQSQGIHAAVWIGSVIAVLVVAFFVAQAAQKGASSKDGNLPTGAQEILTVRQGDWVKGKQSAPVTVIEYSDFQCPACAAYYPLLKDLAAAYPEDVRVVYRHFPLLSIHANARLAAEAAEAAGEQGKFWEMHDLLFDRQSEWSEQRNASASFIAYAKQLGLDEKRFESDMKSDRVRSRVSDSLAGADQLGLRGTPSFFLNGAPLKNPSSLEEFRKAVEDAGAKK